MIGRYGPDQLGASFTDCLSDSHFLCPSYWPMDFPPVCAGRFNFVPIPYAFSQHSKTLPGKPQIFSVLESNQKLVSEEKGPD